jgi:hypothetical protein
MTMLIYFIKGNDINKFYIFLPQNNDCHTNLQGSKETQPLLGNSISEIHLHICPSSSPVFFKVGNVNPHGHKTSLGSGKKNAQITRC